MPKPTRKTSRKASRTLVGTLEVVGRGKVRVYSDGLVKRLDGGPDYKLTPGQLAAYKVLAK